MQAAFRASPAAKRPRFDPPQSPAERSPCRDLPRPPPPGGSSSARYPNAAFYKEKMTFDGIASSIEAPQPECNVGGEDGLTVAAWVKRSKDDVAWDRLIDFGNGAEKENVVISFQEQTMYEVRNGNGVQQLAVGSGTTSASPSSCGRASDGRHSSCFPPDRWMHVALVHDKDGIASIYWNGSLKARGPVWLPKPVHREKYYVGRSHWTHDPYFKGEISDVHVFNYAFSKHEVDKSYMSRSLPASSRGKPILSLASGWLVSPDKPLSDVSSTWGRRRPAAILLPASATSTRRTRSRSCARPSIRTSCRRHTSPTSTPRRWPAVPSEKRRRSHLSRVL